MPTDHLSDLSDLIERSVPTGVHPMVRFVVPDGSFVALGVHAGDPATAFEDEASAILHLTAGIDEHVGFLTGHVEVGDLVVDELWAPTLPIDSTRARDAWDTSTREGLDEIACWVLSRRRDLANLDERLAELDRAA